MNSLISSIPVINKRVKFPVTPHFPGGLMTPEQLGQVTAMAEKYGGIVKIIGGSMTIMGLNLADGEAAMNELGFKPESFIAKSVRGVAICAGKPHCPMAKQDSTALGIALDSEFFGQATPAKVRIGISGCPNCCAEVFVKDIGVFGTAKGFTLIIGGNAGRQAKVGRVIAEDIPSEQIYALVSSILKYYCQHGKDKERLGDTFSRIGWDEAIATIVPAQYRASK